MGVKAKLQPHVSVRADASMENPTAAAQPLNPLSVYELTKGRSGWDADRPPLTSPDLRRMISEPCSFC
jgi:hypothetical protein